MTGIDSEGWMIADGDPNQWAIGLTKATIDRILKSGDSHKGDAVTLYVFYAYTARWQHTTERVHATNSYVARGLGWGEQKVTAVKKLLLALGLIEKVVERGDHGRVLDWRVKINYIVGNVHQNAVFHDLVKSPPNRIELVGRKKKETNNFLLPPSLADLQDTWDAWLTYKRERRNPMTPTTARLQIAKLVKMGVARGRFALLEAMERGWQGFGFNGIAKMDLTGLSIEQLDRMRKERKDKLHELKRRYGDKARETGAVGKQMKQLELEVGEIWAATTVLLDKLVEENDK